jgi:hypothetical protein
MQREDPDGIVIVCDFCRRDWDGQEPMIEGHHGSILCLECLKVALEHQSTTLGGEDKFKCTLCLRFNMPPAMPRWSNPTHPEAMVCQECLYQAAKAFGRNPDVPWKWDASKYPPPVHLPPPAPAATSAEAPADAAPLPAPGA